MTKRLRRTGLCSSFNLNFALEQSVFKKQNLHIFGADTNRSYDNLSHASTSQTPSWFLFLVYCSGSNQAHSFRYVACELWEYCSPRNTITSTRRYQIPGRTRSEIINTSLAMWLMHLTSALRRWPQEYQELFRVILGYTVSLRTTWTTYDPISRKGGRAGRREGIKWDNQNICHSSIGTSNWNMNQVSSSVLFKLLTGAQW